MAGDTYTLVGYLCPTCLTWAEDMTPHCFNEHADDPVATKAIYTKDEAAPTDNACTHPICRCPACNYWPERTGE